MLQKEAEFLKNGGFRKAVSMKEKDLSPIDKLKSVKGEDSQGQYLINAKERNSESKNKPNRKMNTIMNS